MAWGKSPSLSGPVLHPLEKASQPWWLVFLMSWCWREALRNRTSFKEAGLLANLLPAPCLSSLSSTPHFFLLFSQASYSPEPLLRCIRASSYPDLPTKGPYPAQALLWEK